MKTDEAKFSKKGIVNKRNLHPWSTVHGFLFEARGKFLKQIQF